VPEVREPLCDVFDFLFKSCLFRGESLALGFSLRKVLLNQAFPGLLLPDAGFRRQRQLVELADHGFNVEIVPISKGSVCLLQSRHGFGDHFIESLLLTFLGLIIIIFPEAP
jgi:hypothetical protein